MTRDQILAGLRGAPMLLRLMRRAWRHDIPSIGLQDRLAHLPLAGAPVQAPVRIDWDDHAVPFITAANDTDLAVGLGVVHAHLRRTQMEAMRLLAQGRLAEAIGPAALPVDHALRQLGFARIGAAIAADLAEDTRVWASAFLAGVNHVVAHAPQPHELRILDAPRESWALPDLFACARLAATDLSWMIFARLLKARARLSAREWVEAWPRMLAAGMPPFDGTAGAVEAILAPLARTGSNSCAVAAHRAAGGAPLIASDPHLPLALPGPWLIAGLRSPGISAVGLMLAGFPFVALGRNRHIAWGGTSLHAASSELIDATSLPVTARTEFFAVRGGAARPVILRETPLGPLVSDGVLMRSRRRLALRWVGERPSDELGAMLAVMRARDADGFRAALRGFAVPGQTMVYAGTDGRVGRLTAAHLPPRPDTPPDDVAIPPSRAWSLDTLLDSADLPSRFDPADGIVVSANERPDGTTHPVGWFFASGRRAARMRAVLGGLGRVSAADLRRLQRDTLDPSALQLRDRLLTAMARLPARCDAARAALAAWDGRYESGSAGALVFEALTARIARALRPSRLRAADAVGWAARILFAADLLATPPDRLGRLVRQAMPAVARLHARYGSWGAVHRLRPAHHLAVLPLLGRRLAEPDFPGDGGNDTVLKTGHAPVRGRHDVQFGTGARHISDLADPRENLFVLYGGQDGWLGSANATDQIGLWRDGAYIRVPLDGDRAQFRHATILQPGAPQC